VYLSTVDKTSGHGDARALFTGWDAFQRFREPSGGEWAHLTCRIRCLARWSNS